MTNTEMMNYLKEFTNMTEHDIERHVNDGIISYSNSEAGFEEFKENCLAGMMDEDDINDMWEDLEVIGSYRMDFCL